MPTLTASVCVTVRRSGATSRRDAWWIQPLLAFLGLSTFLGPRHLVYAAALEMHPLDTEKRARDLKHAHGVGYGNITKCCTKVCPESITITDNAIIPLKERVIDQLYDPVAKLFRMFRRAAS